MNAYLVSHNGLGDNLYMVGALRFLSAYYETLFFLCKDVYLANVELFFDIPNIKCVPFDSADEYAAIRRIVSQAPGDVIVCGFCHKQYLQSRINNPAVRALAWGASSYTIDHDELTSQNYSFIEGFYRDAGLTLTHFYENFSLPVTQEAVDMSDRARGFYTVFIQLKSSDGKRLNIEPLLSRLDDPGVLLACNDENLYPKTAEKHALADTFVFKPVAHYALLVQNCDEIHVIDSCFVGLVLPYLKTNRLKTNKVRISLR